MIPRPSYLDQLRHLLLDNAVVALLGPRQCGKTTLARMLATERQCEFFDLEDPVDRSLVVLDEVQRQPELFEILRVIVDEPANRARFLVLGSASPSLVKGASESLAGRIGFVDLSGFDLSEVGSDRVEALWHRGRFPRSFLARDDDSSLRWREDFIRTFLERDIPQLGIGVPAETLRRFWTMIAHYHGQIWNAAEFARSLGRAEATARRYLDILSGAYLVRQLQPWHANIRKRQVKSPKVFVRDTGLLHALLSLQTPEQVRGHPKYGASWEGFVIEEILTGARTRNAWFWATHAGAELDLLLLRAGRAIGFEIKVADAPRTTKSMRIAIRDLDLHHLYVVYPGTRAYELDEMISVVPVAAVPGLFSA
jgi:predicted AAA+ superfamily ATPase